MKRTLDDVFWIGGSTFSGKSTVSRLLQEKHGMDLYNCDDMFPEHCRRSEPELHPTFNLIVNKASENVFMLPPEILLAGIKALAREEFGMITDDLADVAAGGSVSVIAEGAPLLPDCVQPLLRGSKRAIWLVSTESFIRERYVETRNELVESVLSSYKDPERALSNWMERDVAFGRWVKGTVQDSGLRMIEVDGTRDALEIMRSVEEYFELG